MVNKCALGQVGFRCSVSVSDAVDHFSTRAPHIAYSKSGIVAWNGRKGLGSLCLKPFSLACDAVLNFESPREIYEVCEVLYARSMPCGTSEGNYVSISRHMATKWVLLTKSCFWINKFGKAWGITGDLV